MSSPTLNEGHIPNWLGQSPLTFAINVEEDFKDNAITPFQGKIIKNLVEHTSQNNVIRALFFSIIDAFLEKVWLFKQSSHYRKYKAFVAQTKMSELGWKKSEVKAEELEKAIKSEVKVRTEELEKAIKAFIVKDMKEKILWNRDELLLKELNQMNYRVHEDYENLKDLLTTANLSREFEQADLSEVIQDVKDEIIDNMKTSEEKRAQFFAEVCIDKDNKILGYRWSSKSELLQRLFQQFVDSQKSDEELCKPDHRDNNKKMSVEFLQQLPQTALMHMKRIAANYPYKDLNIKLAMVEVMELYPESDCPTLKQVFQEFIEEMSKGPTDNKKPPEDLAAGIKLPIQPEATASKVAELSPSTVTETPTALPAGAKPAVTAQPKAEDKKLPNGKEETPTQTPASPAPESNRTSTEKKSESPKKSNLTEKQIAKLKTLLPTFEKFDALLTYLSSSPDRDKEIGHLEKLKTNKSVNIEFFIERVIMSQEEYEKMINDPSFENNLETEHKNLFDTLGYFIQIMMSDKKLAEEFKPKYDLLHFKYEALQKVRKPTQK